MPASRHPINDLLELLGRRWTLRVLWELRDQPLPYRKLRAACGNVSTSVLSTRLRELRDADIVERTEGDYRLTERGAALGDQLLALNEWARRWAESAE
ncbi:MAG: helix-turn-helix transcriptional regulator [Solirubrobacterales bacterium]|nr:helix-turn-helix transcriptional regulator [Solirubrobacterales bacterium]